MLQSVLHTTGCKVKRHLFLCSEASSRQLKAPLAYFCRPNPKPLWDCRRRHCLNRMKFEETMLSRYYSGLVFDTMPCSLNILDIDELLEVKMSEIISLHVHTGTLSFCSCTPSAAREVSISKEASETSFCSHETSAGAAKASAL